MQYPYLYGYNIRNITDAFVSIATNFASASKKALNMKTKKLTNFRRQCIFKSMLILMSLFLAFSQLAFKVNGNLLPESENIESAKSLPIPLELFYSLRQNFSRAYISPELNTAIEKTLKAKWVDLSSYIDIEDLRHKVDTGIALHYILLRDASGNPYFSYAISYARKDQINGITTMPFDGTTQYVCMTDTGMNMISAGALEQYKQNYKDSIWIFTDYPPSANYKIDTLNHPRLTYFDGSNVVQFYENNMNNAPSNGLYLYFFNGARFNDEIKGSSSNLNFTLDVHTAIMAFGDATNVLFVLPGTFDENAPYLNRAMDLGTLCPPKCH